MSIQLVQEKLLTPTAAMRLPFFHGRSGRPGHISKFYRLIEGGRGARSIRGERVYLEVIKLPEGLRTSREAVDRFIESLNA